MDEETLRHAVIHSVSFSEVIRKLGVRYRSGGALTSLRRRVKELNIDHSHFLGMGHRLGSSGPRKRWGQILTNDSGRLHRESAKRLRRALIESGVEERCKLCGLGSKWNDHWLVLDVDHIDGDWRNNSPENLRFLCPNCHSQQETSGRSKGPKSPRKCDGSIPCLCKSCVNKRSARLATHTDKGKWPPDLETIAMEKPITHIARLVGVSEAAVRKRFKRLGIKSKPQGYWSK